MKFSTNDFFGKYDQMGRKLWIWSHLLDKSLMENFIFYAVINSDEQTDRLLLSAQFVKFLSPFSGKVLQMDM